MTIFFWALIGIVSAVLICAYFYMMNRAMNPWRCTTAVNNGEPMKKEDRLQETKASLEASPHKDNAPLLLECLTEAMATLTYYKGWTTDKSGLPEANKATQVIADIQKKLLPVTP